MFGLAPWDVDRLTVDELTLRCAYVDYVNEKSKEARRESKR